MNDEVLFSIMIISIFASIAFVAYLNHLETMKEIELDLKRLEKESDE